MEPYIGRRRTHFVRIVLLPWGGKGEKFNTVKKKYKNIKA